VGTTCFEQDTRENDPESRTGWAAGLDVFDEYIWRMFRQHLLCELEEKAIVAELPYPMLVVLRNPQEGDPCSVLLDPLHLHQIA
jgi:hypothetical protein